jgi:hypothetical protein
MTDRPTYVLRLQALPNVDADRAIRRLLKVLLRQLGLRCIAIEVIEP